MKKFFVFMIFLLCSVITFPDEVATNKSETKEEYLSGKDVILYYYADSAPIYYRNSDKHNFISPQHFRSYLFHTLFTKVNPKDLLISNRIIPNIHIGNHYISFIYKQKHQPYVDTLTKELEEYQNK